MKDKRHSILKVNPVAIGKFICGFFIFIYCNSIAQTINPQGTYVSAHNGKNTFILKKDHTFVYYWYGEIYLVNDKNAPLSFTGKGTWVVKKDTIDSGLSLFLEFTETKGTCSTDQDKIENRYVFLDKDDKRFYSLIYLKEKKRYEPYECFDKINSSKK